MKDIASYMANVRRQYTKIEFQWCIYSLRVFATRIFDELGSSKKRVHLATQPNEVTQYMKTLIKEVKAKSPSELLMSRIL